MKIAFIADIHGNAIALDCVLANIRKNKIDRIYVLGDLCYRGPEPRRSLDLIRALNTDVIKGNADEWVVRGVREGEVPAKAIAMMNSERDWTVSQLEAEDLDYLNHLPTELTLTLDGITISAFHATPASLFDVVPPDADDALVESKLMVAEDSQIFIYAHIHKPYIRYLNGKMIINTGSVGLPFDKLAMASYAMLEVVNGVVHTSIVRVPVDIEQVVQQYEVVKYPNASVMANVVRNASI